MSHRGSTSVSAGGARAGVPPRPNPSGNDGAGMGTSRAGSAVCCRRGSRLTGDGPVGCRYATGVAPGVATGVAPGVAPGVAAGTVSVAVSTTGVKAASWSRSVGTTISPLMMAWR